MKNHFYITIVLLLAGTFLQSCKTYKQHIMFKVDEEHDMAYLASEIMVIEKNYIIQPNDLLKLSVHTNNGERIIDPNNELQMQQNQSQSNSSGQEQEFRVLEDGTVKFPMIGIVKIEGLRINEAEDYLEKKYDEFYIDSYVRLNYLNKRVIVLGAPGGLVIPLENENTSIVEIVALAGGIDYTGKAHNLRLIRGNLHEPEVFEINLSTIQGMRTSMMDALPGDILYIEPRVKVFSEGVRDFTTLFSIITSAITLYVLIVTLN